MHSRIQSISSRFIHVCGIWHIALLLTFHWIIHIIQFSVNMAHRYVVNIPLDHSHHSILSKYQTTHNIALSNV